MVCGIFRSKVKVAALTKEESRIVLLLCDEILCDLGSCQSILQSYSFPEYSFEYQFLFHRIKIAGLRGANHLNKITKEIRMEIRAIGTKPIPARVINLNDVPF